MNAYSNGKPEAVGFVFGGYMQQILGGLDGEARVVWAREARKVQANHFVADEFVYKRIGLDHHAGRGSIKLIHQPAEFGGAHLFGEGGRTADIHEKEGQFNVCATRMIP